MTHRRAALDVGSSTVRVATARDGVDRVVEVTVDPAVPLPELLAGLVDEPAEVVVVDDGRAPHAAVAVAGMRETVVLDVGHRASRAWHVRGGTVVACRTAPGGSRLDQVVADLLRQRCPTWAGRPEVAGEARRVREALSLQPAVTARLSGSDRGVVVDAAEVHAVLREPFGEIVRAAELVAGTTVPVHVVGGGARSPQLVELLDRAGLVEVTVAARPDTAVVRAVLHARVPTAASPVPPVARSSWLPAPPPDGSRPRRAALAAVAVGVLGVLYLWGAALVPPEVEAVTLPSGVLAQYDYRFDVPAGWEHTGGLPTRRRSLVTPVDAPEGSDLIAVESTPLGYDSAAEPRRAAADLRAEYSSAAAGGAPLSGFDPHVRVDGRPVTAYRERDGDTVVRWYVILDGAVQLSVGCRHTPSSGAVVERACATVVASVRSAR